MLDVAVVVEEDILVVVDARGRFVASSESLSSSPVAAGSRPRLVEDFLAFLKVDELPSPLVVGGAGEVDTRGGLGFTAFPVALVVLERPVFRRVEDMSASLAGVRVKIVIVQRSLGGRFPFERDFLSPVFLGLLVPRRPQEGAERCRGPTSAHLSCVKNIPRDSQT